MTYEVIALPLEDIMALRVKVLRKDTPVTHCNYPEDAYEDVVHLGVRHAGIVIARRVQRQRGNAEEPVKRALMHVDMLHPPERHHGVVAEQQPAHHPQPEQRRAVVAELRVHGVVVQARM